MKIKTTEEILNDLSLGEYNDKFEHVLLHMMYDEDKYSDSDSFYKFIRDSMITYAKEILKKLFEDGLGNIDTNQSIDDIIKNYKSLKLI